MKTLPLIISFVLLVTAANGQTLKSYVARLQTSGAAVSQDDTADAALGMIPVVSTVAGFRLCLFNGSDQSARGRAQAIVARMNNTFKNANVEMKYDAPVFKVFAGACLTRVEAAQMLAAVKGEYPEAFIIAERLPIAKIAAGAAAKTLGKTINTELSNLQ